LRRLKDEATKLGFALSTALLPRNSPPSKSGVSSFAFQAPHAGAEKSHDFCYALSKHRHVAENVSFRFLEAESHSFAFQAPHAGAEKSHDFCYALSKHRHVAENVSFRFPKAEPLSFALQAPHAGAEKSHDFCYVSSKHIRVAENVSFRSLEAERLSCALQAPRWMGKGAVRRRWKGLRGWGAVGEKGVFSRQQAALRESGSRLRAVHV